MFDETLYAGSAPHYARGRMRYPAGLVDVFASGLELDGTGRLLDVGCGPGSLTLLLAPLFGSAVGIDADPGMIAEAAGRSAEIEWRCMRAEELPGDLGTFRVVTFAQSFHWMDRPVVARSVRGMLEPGGAWVHVHATTHQGVDGDDPLPLPRPPWDAIEQLIKDFLGPVRRAGRGTLPEGTPSGEDDVLKAAGYSGPVRAEIPAEIVERSAEEVADAVNSLSYAAPHLFGDRLAEFRSVLGDLLYDTAPDGRFAELRREIALDIWRL